MSAAPAAAAAAAAVAAARLLRGLTTDLLQTADEATPGAAPTQNGAGAAARPTLGRRSRHQPQRARHCRRAKGACSERGEGPCSCQIVGRVQATHRASPPRRARRPQQLSPTPSRRNRASPLGSGTLGRAPDLPAVARKTVGTCIMRCPHRRRVRRSTLTALKIAAAPVADAMAPSTKLCMPVFWRINIQYSVAY